MDRTEGYLEGQCLIAMPNMADERFDRAVVFRWRTVLLRICSKLLIM